MADGNSPTPHIAFVGAGNMATSIIGGLIESGHPADLIHAADPVPASLERLAELGPVAIYDNNAAAVAGADVIVLAVKPGAVTGVLADLDAAQSEKPLWISIAAGVALEANDIDVAFAIRSFSGLAADFFGLSDRGYVEEGRAADLVIINPEFDRSWAVE